MSDLQESKSWKEVLFISFCFRFLCVLQVQKKWLTNFSPEVYQELLETTLNLTFHFFRWEFSHKNQVHGLHHSQWNIFLKRMIISNHIFVSHIWVGLFLVNWWIHKPNAKTEGSKTLSSWCQEKLYFNFIYSIKSKYLANWVVGRT